MSCPVNTGLKDEENEGKDGKRAPRRTLRGVALRTCDAPKPAVEVPALHEVRDGPVAVELVERAEEGERGDGAVEEARVEFAECVPCEDA